MRKRQALKSFQKLSRFSSIVGLFGHRQVGKSTFLEQQSREYCSLDDKDLLAQARAQPRDFLSGLKANKSAIDETQLAPEIFPELKLRVQKNKKPGQFFLSGSVRFTSRKAIRESLTGRIAHLELFPLSLGEILEEDLPARTMVDRLLSSEKTADIVRASSVPTKLRTSREKAYFQYLDKGGFPGLCFIRDKKIRDALMRDILQTMLDRDLRLVQSTTLPLSELFDLIGVLAKNSLYPLKLSALSRECGLDPRTISRLINAFEALYLIRRLPLEGGGAKGFTILLEDQAEQNYLAEDSNSFTVQRAGLVYRQIRTQVEYNLQQHTKFFTYRTRGGASIPLGVKRRGGVLGVLPVASLDEYSPALRASVDSFLRQYANSRVVVMAEKEKSSTFIDERVLSMHPTSLLF